MDANELIISFFEQVYNQKDFDYVMELFAENYYEHTETGARSNQDCQTIIKGACSIFPDLQVEINDLISQDEIVAVRLTFTGTHQGEFFGIPATHKQVRFEAMEFFKMSDDLITESWGSWPIYDILQKLRN